MHRSWLSIACGSILLLPGVALPAAAQTDGRVELRIDTSEAEAVLAILAWRDAGQPITDSDWQRLFTSEPYRRLKDREKSMRRSFTDAEFRMFVLSDDQLLASYNAAALEANADERNAPWRRGKATPHRNRSTPRR